MVKAVTGEESRLQLAEDRLSQSGITAQVGLVIGKLSSALDRGFLFDLVPTPPNDAGEPPCSLVGSGSKDDKKKGSKAKSSAIDSSSLFIDKDWVAEHARQVSRLLVGGVKVIGIYVWIGDAAFKNSTMALCQAVQGVAKAAPLSVSDSDERLLLHICYSPRRWACKNCSLASNITSNSLRPCDFKMGRVLSSLQSFRCMYNFSIRVPLYHENTSGVKTLNDVLQEGIMYHARELGSAKAIIDGNLVIRDEPCTSDSLHEIELLLPFMKGAALDVNSQKEVAGILTLTGSVCSYAYLTSREPCSQAVADIKEDIITSLRSRLDIIRDEADGMLANGDGDGQDLISANHIILQPLRSQCTLSFPRRVFIPWLENTFISDYLLPSETLEALKDHFVELLSMDAPEDASTILQPERESLSPLAISFWDMASPFRSETSSAKRFSSAGDTNSATRESSMEKQPTHGSVNFKIPIFILLISVLLGLYLYSSHQ